MARDFFAVTLPALIGIALTLWAWDIRAESKTASLDGRGPAIPRDRQPG
jgi:hypothetical protein